MPVASLVVRIAADIADFEKNIAGVERTLLRTGRNLENIGSRMTKGITLPLVAAVGIAAKAAIDFESSFAGVRKTVDATEAQFAELAQGFRDLAKTMPLSVNEINKVAEAAGQLGVERDRILGFTETMVKLGATTNITADQAASAMARFANAMGNPKVDVDKLAASLVALGNDGASTEQDILQMAGRIAGAGAQIKLTEGSVFGMASALSSVGIEAEKGGSAISRLFNDLNSAVSKGGHDLRDFAAVAGLLPDAFSKLFKEDSAAAITAFIEGLNAQKAAGADLLKILDDLGISELRYRDTVLLAANAAPIFASSIRLGNSAFLEGTAHTKEYEERLKTTASQLTILKNNLTDVAITFGQAFLPIINDAVKAAKPLVQHLADLATAFKELPEPIRNITFGLIALVASLGPIIFVVGKVQQAFAGILGVVRFFIPAMATTGTAATGLGVSFTGLAGSVGRAATALVSWPVALGATAAALVLGEKGMSALGSVASSTAKLLISFASDTLGLLKDGLVAAGEKLVEFGQFAARVSPEIRLLAGAVTLLRDSLAKAAEGFKQVAKEASEGMWLSLANSLRTTNPLLAAFLDLLTKSNIETGRLRGSISGFPALEADWSIRAITGLRSVMDEEERIAQEFPEDFARVGKSIDNGLTKPLKLGGEEIDKAKSKLKELADSFSGAGLITAMQDTVKAVQASGVAITSMTTETQQKITETIGAGIDQLRRLGKEAPLAATEMKNAADAALDSWRNVPTMIGFSVREIERFIEASKRMLTPIPKIELPELNLGIRAFMDEMDAQVRDRLPKAITDSLTLDEVNIGIRAFMDEMDQQIRDRAPSGWKAGWKAGLDDLAASFGTLADVAGGAFGSILDGVGGVIAAFDAYNRRLEQNIELSKTQKAAALLQGAAAVWGSTGQGTQRDRTVGGAMAGAQAGAMFGPYGALIGAAAGAITGFIRGMNAGRSAVKDFAESFGGFDALNAKLVTLGDEGERLWRNLTQGVANNNPAQAQASIDAITAALGRQQAELEALGARIGDLADIATGSGQLLDVSMLPFIKQLRTAGAITDDVAAKLFSLTTDNSASWQHMQGLAEKYGIELDSLGQRFQQQKLSETAGDIIRDFNTLIANGADFNAVLHGMTDEIQGVVLQSLKFGTEIPDNMKPWITELIATGRLLDATGTKITDIDTLKFGPAVKSDVDKLVDAIKELIAAIGTKLPAALTDLTQKRFPPIRIPIEYEDPGFTGGRAVPALAGGGIVRRRTLALVGEAGPEAVIPLNQLGAFSPVSGGGGTVIWEVDGRVLAEAIVPHYPGVIRQHVRPR